MNHLHKTISVMLGAIIGDIAGSRFEFDATNDYHFEIFSKDSSFTDDTICTIAVADAILKKRDYGESIHEWCRKYPHPMGGYGGNFSNWVMSDHPKPYGSYGNGAAMRVSPVAEAFRDDWDAMLNEAKRTAACTHNHPEGIKGAQAVAVAIHDCRELHVKYNHIGAKEIEEGLKRAVEMSDYDIHINLKEVQNHFDETCQGTVPVAFWIIANSYSFEDAIRKAVSLGADADTLGAIVGSIAEAIWRIPEWMKKKALTYLPDEMKKVLRDFRKAMKDAYPSKSQAKQQKQGAAAETVQNKKGFQAMMFWKLCLGNANKWLFGGNPLPDKSIKATATSWKIIAMPDSDEVSTLEMNVSVHHDAMAILQHGHIPESQEDHWFMYCTKKHIRYYRSWTGICAFEAHLKQKGEDYVIDSLRINHALLAFGVNGDIPGLFLFLYLITTECGGDADKAWKEYLNAWDSQNDKDKTEKNRDESK